MKGFAYLYNRILYAHYTEDLQVTVDAICPIVLYLIKIPLFDDGRVLEDVKDGR